MMRPHAGLIVALSLLASAATVYAKCAWVLWRQVSYLGRDGLPTEGVRAEEKPMERFIGIPFDASPTPWTRAGRREADD